MNAITKIPPPKNRKIANEVLAVLFRSTLDENSLHLPEQLDRKDYLAAAKVIIGLGGKWSRKHQAHVWPADTLASDVIDHALHTGSYASPQDFNWFETPPAIADLVIARADIHPGHRVLEPSAGRGALSMRALAITPWVDSIELDKGRSIDLQRNHRSMSATGMCIEFCGCDFLDLDPETWQVHPKTGRPSQYDRIVMNPPFARRQDIAHVRHALRFLKPDGKLVSVMSAGVSFRTDQVAKQFIDELDDRGAIIEPLPGGCFKSSGTGVNTVLVTIPGQS